MDTVLANPEAVRFVRTGRQLYREMLEYGLEYPINYDELYTNITPETRIVDLPDGWDHLLRMAQLLAPYRYPNLGFYFKIFLACAFSSYLLFTYEKSIEPLINKTFLGYIKGFSIFCSFGSLVNFLIMFAGRYGIEF
jgi:hypothetical protein